MNIKQEKINDEIKESRIEGAADLVIEILSKSTKKLDLTEKLPKYLKAGVKEVWIIDPKSRTISIHHKDSFKELIDLNNNFIENDSIFVNNKSASQKRKVKKD